MGLCGTACKDTRWNYRAISRLAETFKGQHFYIPTALRKDKDCKIIEGNWIPKKWVLVGDQIFTFLLFSGNEAMCALTTLTYPINTSPDSLPHSYLGVPCLHIYFSLRCFVNRHRHSLFYLMGQSPTSHFYPDALLRDIPSPLFPIWFAPSLIKDRV